MSAHRSANLFGSLACAPEFHRRALGTSRGVARDQARALSRTGLLFARASAARWLLTSARLMGDRGAFEEITERLFGRGLPSELAGAWPAPLDDAGARLLALFTTLPLTREMVERFDVDWFRNPRAAAHLASCGAVPAHEPGVKLEDEDVNALGRAFEEALA